MRWILSLGVLALLGALLVLVIASRTRTGGAHPEPGLVGAAEPEKGSGGSAAETVPGAGARAGTTSAFRSEQSTTHAFPVTRPVSPAGEPFASTPARMPDRISLEVYDGVAATQEEREKLMLSALETERSAKEIFARVRSGELSREASREYHHQVIAAARARESEILGPERAQIYHELRLKAAEKRLSLQDDDQHDAATKAVSAP